MRLVETTNRQSTVVFEALVVQNENETTFDFSPIQVDGLEKLEEYPNSDF